LNHFWSRWLPTEIDRVLSQDYRRVSIGKIAYFLHTRTKAVDWIGRTTGRRMLAFRRINCGRFGVSGDEVSEDVVKTGAESSTCGIASLIFSDAVDDVEVVLAGNSPQVPIPKWTEPRDCFAN
jgi:hypothetical protein